MYRLFFCRRFFRVILFVAAVLPVTILETHAAGANYEQLGKAEISSLTDLAGDAGAFAKKISPSLESLPFLAVIALTMNPEYLALDLSGRISMYMYAVSSQAQWCTVAGYNNNEKIPVSIKFMGEPAYVKKIDSRLLLSHSKILLDYISKLPPVNKDSSDASITFFMKVSRYLELCPSHYAEFRQKYIETALLKNLQKKHGDAAAGKMLAAVNDLENAIRQIQEISLNIYFKPEYLVLQFEIVPVANSELEKFIDKQELNSSVINLPPVVKDKDIAATVELKSSEDFIYHLPGLIADFKHPETTETEKKLLKIVATAIGERLSYYTNVYNGTPVFYVKTWPIADKIAFLRNNLAMGEIKPFEPNTFTIKESTSGDKSSVYCKLYPNSIAVLSGKISAVQAAELFHEAENPENLKPMDNKNPLEIVLQHQPNTAPSLITTRFKDKKLSIHAKISPEFAKNFIPQNLGLKINSN